MITVVCTCGNVMAAAEEHAGHRVRCPGCKQAVAVPTGEDRAGPTQAVPPKASPAVTADRPRARDAAAVRVSLVDLDVSWFNLAAFLVKAVTASFPAAVVAYLLYGVAYALLTRR